MMDDEPKTPKAKGEGANKNKDGYAQLAEKMEQVKTQMAKMERKYDELYQTVKEANRNQIVLPTRDEESPDEGKAHEEVLGKMSHSSTKLGLVPEPGPESPLEDNPNKPSSAIDIEKMEDNPFM